MFVLSTGSRPLSQREPPQSFFDRIPSFLFYPAFSHPVSAPLFCFFFPLFDRHLAPIVKRAAAAHPQILLGLLFDEKKKEEASETGDELFSYLCLHYSCWCPCVVLARSTNTILAITPRRRRCGCQENEQQYRSRVFSVFLTLF